MSSKILNMKAFDLKGIGSLINSKLKIQKLKLVFV